MMITAREWRAGASMTDSHFAVSGASAGCDTTRCQTSACSPSVCGVTNWSSTVGISTHASARAAQLASVATGDADDRSHRPTARVSMARTRLTLIDAVEASAAHREDEQAVAVAESCDVRSHSAYDESQPSSLIRAVSSETLSVTA